MQGGSYERGADGVLKRVGGTEPHQDGSRARDADGAALNGRGAVPTPVPPEPTNPVAPAANPETGGPKRQPKKPE